MQQNRTSSASLQHWSGGVPEVSVAVRRSIKRTQRRRTSKDISTMNNDEFQELKRFHLSKPQSKISSPLHGDRGRMSDLYREVREINWQRFNDENKERLERRDAERAAMDYVAPVAPWKRTQRPTTQVKKKTPTPYQTYKKAISLLDSKLRQTQAKCKHVKFTKEHKEIGDGYSTGRNGSRYVTNCTCLRCGKWWQVEGSL